MAVARSGSLSQSLSSANRSSVTLSHTTEDNSLCIVHVCLEGNESVSGTPTYNSVNMTLIRDTGSTGNNADTRTYVYGILVTTGVTANVAITYASNSNPDAVSAFNYTGHDPASVAAATNFLSEDVNTTGTNTGVHASAGTSGNALVCMGHGQGSDMGPASWTAAFNSRELYDTETGTSTTADFSVMAADLLTGLPSACTLQYGAATDENSSVYIEIVVDPGGSNTATGAPSAYLPTSSGAASVTHTSTGAPSTSLPTASGAASVTHLSTGAPSILLPTSSGAATVTHKSTGAPSTLLPTAAGVADTFSTAEGAPSAYLPTASGTAKRGLPSSGSPSAFLPTASGTTALTHPATGAPSIALATASGAATVTHLATGAPSTALLTSSGAAVVTHLATGAPSTLLPTATGEGTVTAGGTNTATGAPTAYLPTASGTAKRGLPASGSPSVALATASGSATVTHIASGSPITALPTASGSETVGGAPEYRGGPCRLGVRVGIGI